MSKRTKLLLLGVLIIAGFLRFYHITLTPPGLYPDEAMNGSNSLESLQNGHFPVFYPENNGREALFINIQALTLKYVFGVPGNLPEPWMLRIVSAVFGTLTVLGLFLLTRELFYRHPKRDTIAILATFLIATSFWHIMFSRIGFRAITAPFWLVWALYLLLLSLRLIRNTAISKTEKFQAPSTKSQINNNDQKNQTKPVWSLVLGIWLLPLLAGAAYGSGFHSYIAYRTTPLIVAWIFLWYLIQAWREKWLKRLWLAVALFGVATVIAVTPLLIYFAQNPGTFFGRTTQVSVMGSAHPILELAKNTALTTLMFFVMGDWNWRHNYAGAPEFFAPVAILFLIGIILYVHRIVQKIRSRFAPHPSSPYKGEEGKGLEFGILWSWIFCAFLPVILSDEGIPHALRSILLIPPAIILAALGGVWAGEWLKTRLDEKWLHGLTAILVLICVAQAYIFYFVLWANNPNVPGSFAADYVSIAKEINALPNDTPKYVIVEAGGVEIRGIPMPSQTVMFLTESFTQKEQTMRNIHYLLPSEESQIPANAQVFHIR